MGVYWCSYAEVVSTEPEVIKELIEKAKTLCETKITSIYDLTIDGNSVLFNSRGYGCYQQFSFWKQGVKILLKKEQELIS